MNILLLLVLVSGLFLFDKGAEGQIRMGPLAWTAPCQVVTNGTANFYSINFLDDCDMWHAPHIANPFFLMVITRSWVAAFFVSGLFEIVECLMVVIFQNFALFAGAANSLENLPDVLIDDWLIQAGLGTLLGAWVCWYFDPPALWRGWYVDKGRFMWWLLWYALVMVPQTAYGINLNDTDPTGFPLGPTITIGIIGLVFMFLVENEPRMEQVWSGRTVRSRYQFWVAVITIYFSFYYVVQFDFFFGSAPQTWLLWGVWIIIWFVWALVNKRGPEILDLLNWQQRYLRERAKWLKKHAKIIQSGIYYVAGWPQQSVESEETTGDNTTGSTSLYRKHQ